jgi:hypothetical protein
MREDGAKYRVRLAISLVDQKGSLGSKMKTLIDSGARF